MRRSVRNQRAQRVVARSEVRKRRRESRLIWSVVEEERFMDFVILYLVIFVLTIVLLLTPMNVVLRRFHDYLSSRSDENKESYVSDHSLMCRKKMKDD